MHEVVLAGLAKRRADLTHEHDRLRARLLQIASEVAHLDAVTRQFDPDYRPIPVDPARREDPLHRGQRSRALLNVLREAGKPLTVAEIVTGVSEIEGYGELSREDRRAITRRIETALARQERRGVLRSLRNRGEFVVWEVAG